MENLFWKFFLPNWSWARQPLSSARSTLLYPFQMLSAKQGSSNSHLLTSFGMTRPGIEPTTSRLWGGRSTDWANTHRCAQIQNFVTTNLSSLLHVNMTVESSPWKFRIGHRQILRWWLEHLPYPLLQTLRAYFLHGVKQDASLIAPNGLTKLLKKVWKLEFHRSYFSYYHTSNIDIIKKPVYLSLNW